MNTTTTKSCRDCHHAPHAPGQCLSCNCGESHISHLTAGRQVTFSIGPNVSSLGGYAYDLGHRVPNFVQREGLEY